MNDQPNEQPQPEPVQAEPTAPAPKKAKKQKPPSRGDRFMSAAQDVMDAIGDLRSAWEEHSGALESALEELKSVQQEYQDWYDNMPEGLQQSGTGEKLDAICQLDLEQTLDEPDFDSIEGVAQECLDADIPLGFGRD